MPPQQKITCLSRRFFACPPSAGYNSFDMDVLEEEKIKVITSPISMAELKTIAAGLFGDMVKAVVDLEKRIMAVGGELHADEEAVLLDQGSGQSNLWGLNIYVDQPRETWIEFDSMINIRPSQGNRSRSIGDAEVQKKLIEIVNSLIQ